MQFRATQTVAGRPSTSGSVLGDDGVVVMSTTEAAQVWRRHRDKPEAGPLLVGEQRKTNRARDHAALDFWTG